MGVNFILAAGDSERWKGRTPKQLMEFDGETIVGRIIRQLDGDAVVVSDNHDILKGVGATPFDRRSRRNWITAAVLLDTRHYWGSRARVFLGDVIYSDEATATILDSTAPLAVFGKRWEIFALSFSQVAQPEVIKALKLTISQAEAGDRGKLWEFYRNYAGLDVTDKHALEDRIFHHITDWTDDIDTLQEYCDFMQKNQPQGPSTSEILRDQVHMKAVA